MISSLETREGAKVTTEGGKVQEAGALIETKYRTILPIKNHQTGDPNKMTKNQPINFHHKSSN